MLVVKTNGEDIDKVSNYDYYCIYCRKYFCEADIKKISINAKTIAYTILRYCPICDSKGLIPVCEGCHDGLMLKPQLPVSGDYNRDGTLDVFCNECGEGYKRIVLGFARVMIKTSISKRKVKDIVDKVFTRRGLPYNEKKLILDLIGSDLTRDNVIKIISKECHEDKEFLRERLRK